MHTRQKTILFVDDEPWFNRGMIGELEDAGYRVVNVSEDGTEALKVLEREPFDLIVLDIMMPTGDRITDPKDGRRTGVKVCEYIRQEMRLKTPIIFLTVIEDQTVHSYLEKVEREAGLEATILVKPVAPLDLLEEVNDLIGSPI
jgi:putative two-component system response regulator